jgi:hypothetical protein
MVVSENAVQLGVNQAVGTRKGRNGRSIPVQTFVLGEFARDCKGKAADDLVFSRTAGGYLPRPNEGR